MLYKKEYIKFIDIYNAKFIKSNKKECLERIELYKNSNSCPKCRSDRIHYGRNDDYIQCFNCGYYLFSMFPEDLQIKEL